MENQVKKSYTKNKIQPTGEDAVLDLNWCLGIFANGWMRLLGIDEIEHSRIPTNNKIDWRWFFRFIHRWTFIILSIGVNSLMFISFYLKTRDSEVDGTNKNSTLRWNEWMDYIVTSLHSFSTHLCLLIFVAPNWNDFRLAMNETEYFLIDSRVGRVYPRLRKIMPFAVISIILMVINSIVFILATRQYCTDILLLF